MRETQCLTSTGVNNFQTQHFSDSNISSSLDTEVSLFCFLFLGLTTSVLLLLRELIIDCDFALLALEGPDDLD